MNRRAYDIILAPIETEKSLQGIEANNRYTFKVDIRANKTEIRQAIEEIFNVKVQQVNTMRVRGKKVRMGRFEGKRPDWKKAIVTLKPNYKIDLFTGL